MAEEHHVHVLEEAVAHVEGLPCHEFLRDPGPDDDGAAEFLPLHDALDRQRRRDVHRHAGVVAFAMAGRALDQGFVPRNPGLLVRLRQAVDVRAQGDDRLARPPGREPRRRDAGDAFRDGKPVLAQHAGQVAGRLDFLKAQLTEAEDLIDHLLRERLHGVDLRDRLLFQRLQPGVGGVGARRGRRTLRRGRREARRGRAGASG